MWRTLVNRREFTDLILSGQKVSTEAIETEQMFQGVSRADRGAVLYWKENPSFSSAFPVAAVLDDNELESFFAAINASGGAPSPFSAFCRVISTSEATLYTRARPSSGERIVLQALAGLSYSEAMIHAEGALRPQDLSPAICKRTMAFAWGKALSNGVPIEQLSNLIEGWYETLLLSSPRDRIDAMRRTIGIEVPLLHTAAQLYYGLTADSPITTLCQALIDGDRSQLARHWDSLTKYLPERVSLAEIESSTREERGSYFQSALRSMSFSSSGEDIGSAICAFLATQISPGTFEHLDILGSRNNPSLVLWYSFMAALQKPRGQLGFNGGLGSRVLRDVERVESFEDRPTGDISLGELRVLARAGLEGVAKRLGHSNEIEVEVIPLVTCSFRFYARQSRQHDFLEDQYQVAHAAKNLPAPEAPPKTVVTSPAEQIQQIIKSLEGLANTISQTNANEANQTPTKRPRKRS
jgi:hypothetical protein